MKITVVSRSWPTNEHSGVSMAAAEHVNILVANGHDISIIGANASVLEEALPVSSRFYVPSSGSGALYSPARVDLTLLSNALISSGPDLVITEAWQTALTDAAVDVSYGMGIPVLMISHGVSVHPYSNRLADVGRSLAWSHYRSWSLPKRISRLSALTTLDDLASSRRFHDRDIARLMGISVIPLVNAPIHWRDSAPEFSERKRQVLVVGYFSAVKNQLAAIDVFAKLSDTLQLRFIGPRIGAYYLKCVRRVAQLGLGARVTFSQDDECNIADEIANSLVVLCTSITEALPVTLLEAMASGTPFVATPVGAIPALGAGITANDIKLQQLAICGLVGDSDLWSRLSAQGMQVYRARYTYEHVSRNLIDAVSIATKASSAN